jgi:DNA ligase-1
MTKQDNSIIPITSSMKNIIPMLAKEYEGDNPVGWWLSEKLDGVRAIWTGKELVSRNGKVFNAPEWFIAGLPADVMLDGELFEARGMFQQTVGKVRSKQGDWSNITFQLFDALYMRQEFEARQYRLGLLELPTHCKIVEQTRCESRQHLTAYEKNILSLGGEGVMLREPRSLYECKRSGSLRKLKVFQSSEAVIIGHETGKGKYAGMLGALVCNFAGKVFNIGTGLTDNDRANPPPIGKKVTFSFFELTNGGIPRFPVFVAVRDYE